MSSYTISNTKLNPNRVFILQKSEIEKRLDPFYYVPELVELERKVLAKQPKRLRDYVKGIASGATPKTAEVEKYYSDEANGIPFLRVQNLSPTGILEFSDCKYINKETHNRMLKRSQVSAGDLLVKITGVGRMAIASVAPENFEGNINQHVCVIKTGGKEISETLAAYLNSDIAEKLASRRSTGGTRPALDYPALLSIPVIEDKRILEITKKVIEQKKQNEAEAEKLLSSIDDYLLGELEINLPEPPKNTLKNRMFTVNINEVSGDNLSPIYYLKLKYSTYTSKYEQYQLKDISIMYQPKTISQQDMSEKGKYKVYGANGHIGYYDYYNHKDEEIMITCRGATCGEINKSESKSWITGNAMVVRLTKDYIIQEYLFNILKTLNLDVVITGSAQPQITRENLKTFKIPIPPLDKQKEIAEHISGIRVQAQKLKDKTAEALKKASKEIEKILIGD